MSGTALWRVGASGGVRLARGPVDGGPRELLPASYDVDALLADPGGLAAALRAPADGPLPARAPVLVPIAGQEVWASGVTFERSRSARNEEAGGVDYYDRIYAAERPELFVKAAPGRSRGPDEPIGIRADSGWDVPEPELGLVADARGELVAYTVGNDVSSRSIEGANPLYLPQAKVYRWSCAVGPCLVPIEEAPDFDDLEVQLRIDRGGRVLYEDAVPLTAMRRQPVELLDWLFRGMDFPVGVVLLTGTSIVPPPEFTLRPADEVAVSVPGVGTLRNPVDLVDTRPRTTYAGAR